MISLLYTKIFKKLISVLEKIPDSRPKLSDLYTPSQSKLLENYNLEWLIHVPI